MIMQDADKVRGVLSEISNAYARIEAEREFIKEAISEAAEKYQLEKAALRKMSRLFHKGNFNEEKTSAEELFSTYENILNNTKAQH